MKNLRLKIISPIIELIYDALAAYPAPLNLTYFWNYGIYALICLAIQIITGIALAMHYNPAITGAFESVEHIMRDVNYGWLIRYIHANGASLFFVVVYVHTFRGIYYGSYVYPREHLWMSGVVILFLMILTAFMGYVLPWGQMSFWGATVITNLASAIPFIGTAIVEWLWGGWSVDSATLTRFYSLHYFFPFVIVVLVFVHLLLLHTSGSNNPLGTGFGGDSGITFSPYYLVKDVNGLVVFLASFAFFLYFSPDLLGHPDNYLPANPLVTPSHIVPEWYFLPFYAILRSIPNKFFGVVFLMLAIGCLLMLPLIHNPQVRAVRFRPFSKMAFWYLVITCFVLGWIGGMPVEDPFFSNGSSGYSCLFCLFCIYRTFCYVVG